MELELLLIISKKLNKLVSAINSAQSRYPNNKPSNLQVTWHGRGDYVATVMSEAGNRSVVIHQVSTHRSQIPFAKPKGLVQCALFHPVRPFIFVAVIKFLQIIIRLNIFCNTFFHCFRLRKTLEFMI